MKIGILVWSMCAGKGGMERAGAELANFFQRNGDSVTMFYNRMSRLKNLPAYPLHGQIRLCEFMIMRTGEGLKQARSKIIEAEPDVMLVLFSHSDFLVVPGLLHNTGIPCVYAEHNHPAVIMDERWNRKEHMACASAADAIVLLLDSYKKEYPAFLHDRIRVIPNSVDKPRGLARVDAPVSGRWRLLGVGRFYDQAKQFSLLIRAFALLAPSFPDWDLCLCGDGVNRRHYEQLVAGLGLESRIAFTGVVDDIDSYYAASHLFCIPSLFEGLPLVMIEAMCRGIPVAGFSGCQAVGEVIRHAENGMLAQEMTSQSLAETLRPMMQSPELRKKLGEQALADSTPYAPKTVFRQWRDLVEEVAQYKGKTRLNIDIPQDDEARAAAMLTTILQRDYPFEELPRKM